MRREICVTKSATLMLERKCASQDRLGEERYVSKVLLILAVKM